ncbi:hypothetical protein MRX96_010037 [Rhipicephalus microplus]
MFQRWSSSCVSQPRLPCESGSGGSTCRVRCSSAGALRACHSQDYHARVVLVAPLAESDVPALELFVRATAKITMREWFWWLHLPSPMFQRWSSSAGAHRACHSEDYHARVVPVAPLAESDVPALVLIVLCVVALFCWFMLLRLLMALSAVTVFVLETLLITAMVVSGTNLLCALTDFTTDTFREVFTMCNQFLQDPSQEHLFHKAWRRLNM